MSALDPTSSSDTDVSTAWRKEPSSLWLWATLILLAMITFMRLLALIEAPYNLYADEAQYWYWAQHLDWGYYSKPPMVAWAIALTTSWCGNTEPCVKFASPLLYAFTAFMLYLTASWLYDRRTGFWTALLFITLPGVVLSSTIISTDPLLLFFWSVGLYGFLRALDDNRWRWWLLTGIACGLGMMSKYNFVFFGVSVLLLLWWRRETQGKQLLNPRLWVAVLIAFVIFLPNIWWNWQHDFVSFQHTRDISGVDDEREGSFFNPLQLLEFIGAQAGLFGPILFVALVIMLMRVKRVLKDPRQQVMLAFVLPMAGTILALSMFSDANGNWAAPIYVSATLAVVSWLVWHRRHVLLVAILVTHIAAAYGFYNFEAVASQTGVKLTHRNDPFFRVKGWDILGVTVEHTLKEYPDVPVLSDRRKMSATLLYYLRESDVEVVQWNPKGKIGDHFALTTTLEGREGKDFLLVVPKPVNKKILARFSKVEKLEDVKVPLYEDGTGREFEIYLLKGFKGYAE